MLTIGNPRVWPREEEDPAQGGGNTVSCMPAPETIPPPGVGGAVRLGTAELRNVLAGRIEPVSVTARYRSGLLLVTLATPLLPVVYLGLVAVPAWGVLFCVFR